MILISDNDVKQLRALATLITRMLDEEVVETQEALFTEPIKPQRTRDNLRYAYPRNGFGWTPAEDRNLMVYRLANLDIDEMADLLGRSPKAIRDHILVVDGKRLPNGTVVR